jgi:NAD+ synthase (glutamine-hydrolysing)
MRTLNFFVFSDNRFDHRPFLYRANWSWQFKAIDDELDRITRSASSHKFDQNEGEASKTRSESYGKLTLEKQQSSPMTFGSSDGLPGLQHDGISNGISGAVSSGNISAFEKNSGVPIKKSQSTGYSKNQVNVLGKIKDRTGVPV